MIKSGGILGGFLGIGAELAEAVATCGEAMKVGDDLLARIGGLMIS